MSPILSAVALAAVALFTAPEARAGVYGGNPRSTSSAERSSDTATPIPDIPIRDYCAAAPGRPPGERPAPRPRPCVPPDSEIGAPAGPLSSGG